MSELVIRPLTAGEEQLFESLCDPGLAGPAAFNHTYADGAAKGHYRPEWTWVALLDGVVLARAAWWGGPDDDQPVVLDWFDFTHADAATRLLRESGHRTGYRLRLPADWRERPEARAAGRARIDAATAAGLTLLVERYRYCWTPDCGLPERPGRLEFRPEPDDVVILDVFRRIHWGTLDAHTRRVMAESGIDAAAKEDLDILLWFPSPRGWWRLAYTPDGDLGMIEPGETAYQAAVRELREETGIHEVDLAFAAAAEFELTRPDRQELLAIYRVRIKAVPRLTVNCEVLDFRWWLPSEPVNGDMSPLDAEIARRVVAHYTTT